MKASATCLPFKSDDDDNEGHKLAVVIDDLIDSDSVLSEQWLSIIDQLQAAHFNLASMSSQLLCSLEGIISALMEDELDDAVNIDLQDGLTAIDGKLLKVVAWFLLWCLAAASLSFSSRPLE